MTHEKTFEQRVAEHREKFARKKRWVTKMGQPPTRSQGLIELDTGIRVLPGGKPPKLQFRPGNFIRYRGQLHEIIYCYRLKEQPHEWHFYLEERPNLHTSFGVPKPIIWDLFLNGYDAACHFYRDKQGGADSLCISNKSLLQDAGFVSSGAVDCPVPVPPKGLPFEEKIIDVTPVRDRALSEEE